MRSIVELDRFKVTPPTDPTYPALLVRVLYSPVDDVHGGLLHALEGCEKSLTLHMYGFDDDELAARVDALIGLLGEDKVQIVLDSSQAGGTHEKAILAKYPRIAAVARVGRSERGAIMHRKVWIIDGRFLITGSTNLSDGGETKQDNELTVHDSPAMCREAQAILDREWAHLAPHAPVLKAA